MSCCTLSRASLDLEFVHRLAKPASSLLEFPRISSLRESQTPFAVLYKSVRCITNGWTVPWRKRNQNMQKHPTHLKSLFLLVN